MSAPAGRSRRAHHGLPANVRLVVATVYLLALLGLARWAHHGWPPSSAAGLWFYSAAVAVLLAVFLNEPFFTTPRAVLGSSGALFVFALTASRNGLHASNDAITDGRIALLAFSGFVFVLAAVALGTRARARRSHRSRSDSRFCSPLPCSSPGLPLSAWRASRSAPGGRGDRPPGC